jgi:hypothetical protein
MEDSMDPSQAFKASNLVSTFSIFADKTWTAFTRIPRNYAMEDCARVGLGLETAGTFFLFSSNCATLEYCTFVRGNLFTWISKKHAIVASSSTKAKFRAMGSWYL